MPKRSSQGFFNFNTPMMRHKTDDQIATERILAKEMAENPELRTPTDERVRLDMRDRMKKQRYANQMAETGKVAPEQRRR